MAAERCFMQFPLEMQPLSAEVDRKAISFYSFVFQLFSGGQSNNFGVKWKNVDSLIVLNYKLSEMRQWSVPNGAFSEAFKHHILKSATAF